MTQDNPDDLGSPGPQDEGVDLDITPTEIEPLDPFDDSPAGVEVVDDPHARESEIAPGDLGIAVDPAGADSFTALMPKGSSPEAAPKRSRAVVALIAVIVAAVLGAGGYLGWDYWKSREWADQLGERFIAARTAEGESSNRSEESGEAAAASALASTLDELEQAPWWTQICYRAFHGPDIESFRSMAGELAQNAQDRGANRKWWAESTQLVEEAIADEQRTIPMLQGVLDDFQSSEAPKAGAGGFDPAARAPVAAKLEADLQALMDAQNARLSQLDALGGEISRAESREQLAGLTARLDEPGALDRNPPEIEDALSQLRKVSTEVGNFLARRDAVLEELASSASLIGSLDRENTALASVESIRAGLARLQLPEDSRFDEARSLLQQADAAAQAVAGELAVRDEAIGWIAQRAGELSNVQSLDEMDMLDRKLSEEHPQSDNPRALAARAELNARVDLRRAQLEEEKRLHDESMARSAAFETGVVEFAQRLEDGQISQAAATLAALKPEDSVQGETADKLRSEFPRSALQRITAMRDAAVELKEWGNIARTMRETFDSADVDALAPTLEAECAAIWSEVSFEEDREMYEECLTLGGAPYSTLGPALQRYIDPARLRGGTPPMLEQAQAYLQALETPGVTVQIEGVEWAASACQEASTGTTLTVEVSSTPFVFELGSATVGQPDLLGGEEHFQQSRADVIPFSVSGFFECDGDPGVFVGAGELTLDDLRAGGHFALPFWSGGDQATAPHQLLLQAIPDDSLLVTTALPPWIDPRPPVAPVAAEGDAATSPPEAVPTPVEPEPVDPTDPMNPRAIED